MSRVKANTINWRDNLFPSVIVLGIAHPICARFAVAPRPVGARKCNGSQLKTLLDDDGLLLNQLSGDFQPIVFRDDLTNLVAALAGFIKLVYGADICSVNASKASL
jgi:hypothetical protein